ncbi:MAG: hypothetical protein ACJ77K_12680 [Bacteroidia bacterium]
MRPKIKHLAVYAFIIAAGFLFARIFLPKSGPELTPPPAPKQEIPLEETTLLSEVNDMESAGDFVTTEKALSGKKSCKLSEKIEYGISAQHFVRDIPSYTSLNKITVQYSCFMQDDPGALFVLSIDDPNGKNLHWAADSITMQKSGQWTREEAIFTVAPELLNPDNKISLYPWNKKKKTFFIDDIRIAYDGAVAKKGMHTDPGTTNFFSDMESNEGMSGTDAIITTTAHSGKKACDLSGGKEYGPSVSKKIREFGTVPKRITMSMWVYPLTDQSNTVLTVAVTSSKNESISWDGESTDKRTFPKNTWTKLNTSFVLPTEKMHPDDVLTVNIWNKGKSDVIVDDLEIVYGEGPERRGEPSTVDAKSIYDKTFQARDNKPPFRTLWLEKQETGNNSDLEQFNPGDTYIAGNFAEDKNGLDELLCISGKRQALYAYDPEAKQFKKLWENTNKDQTLWTPANSYIVVNDGSRKKLVVENTGFVRYLVFNGKEWIDGPKETTMCVPAVFAGAVAFYPGHFNTDGDQFLELDRSWRFDLKLKENGHILGSVDFKGFPADHNPKYYEFVTLINGHFTDAKRNSVIVVMANCADNDFKGDKCKTLDNLQYLPNCTQLYQFAE